MNPVFSINTKYFIVPFIIIPCHSFPTKSRLSTHSGHWARFRYPLPNPMPWVKIWKNEVSSSSGLQFATPSCKLQVLSTIIWQPVFPGKFHNRVFKICCHCYHLLSETLMDKKIMPWSRRIDKPYEKKILKIRLAFPNLFFNWEKHSDLPEKTPMRALISTHVRSLIYSSFIQPERPCPF